MKEIEGVIKYNLKKFTQLAEIPKEIITPLEKWRKKLYQLGLIGLEPKTKLGYGNLSQKLSSEEFPDRFLITGSQTGHLSNLSGNHYVFVNHFDIENMDVEIEGALKASSETLTHAAIYQHNSLVNAVFHIHNLKIWKLMIEKEYPHTSEKIPYGTKAMALAVQSLIGKNKVGAFAMAGHEEGVIAYGDTLDNAGNILVELYNKFISSDR